MLVQCETLQQGKLVLSSKLTIQDLSLLQVEFCSYLAWRATGLGAKRYFRINQCTYKSDKRINILTVLTIINSPNGSTIITQLERKWKSLQHFSRFISQLKMTLLQISLEKPLVQQNLTHASKGFPEEKGRKGSLSSLLKTLPTSLRVLYS